MTYYSISGLVNAITSTIVAVIVLIRNPKLTLNRSFSYFALSVAFWSYCYFLWQISNNADSALFWCRALMAGAVFIPPTFLHFSTTLIKQYKKFSKVVTSWYFVSVIFLLLDFTPLFVKDVKPRLSFPYWPTAGITYALFLAIFIGLTIYAHILMYKSYKKLSGLERNQIKYVFLGTTIGFLGGSTNYPLWYDIPIPPVGNALVAVYVLLVAYAIVKYRLMDIKIVITRASIFIAVYTVVLGLPFAIAMWTKTWPIPLSLMALLATIGPYLYIWIDRRAEERIFKELREQQKMLKTHKKDMEDAAKTMILVHEPDTLIKMIVRTMVQKVKVSHAGILLHNKDKDTYILTISRGQAGLKIPEGFTRMDSDNALIRFFKQGIDRELFGSSSLVHDEAEKLLKTGNLDPEKKEILKGALYQMEIFDAQACIPSYFRDELLGILLLGNKINGEKFAEDELNFFVALASDVAMAIRNAQLFKDLALELDKNKRLFIHTTIALAAAIDAKDHYTHGHTARVTNLSLQIAKKLGQKKKVTFNEKFLENLQIGGLLHDIGKIGIPESILNKEAPLNDEEKKRMQEHPTVGVTILQPIKELEEPILGVKYHHEKFDGSGYPEGLKGGQIPLIAAIISVADTFDAMTTDRPYRRGLTKKEAVEEIRLFSGKQFDPQIAETFVELYQEGLI